MEEPEYDKVTQASLNGIYVKAQEMDRGHNDVPAPSFAPPGARADVETHASTHASDTGACEHGSGACASDADASTHASVADAQTRASDADAHTHASDAEAHASTHASEDSR